MPAFSRDRDRSAAGEWGDKEVIDEHYHTSAANLGQGLNKWEINRK